jgi:hypothetical protein
VNIHWRSPKSSLGHPVIIPFASHPISDWAILGFAQCIPDSGTGRIKECEFQETHGNDRCVARSIESPSWSEEAEGKLGREDRLVLSMGMSSDFEAVLKAGSDIVRVGTGIF